MQAEADAHAKAVLEEYGAHEGAAVEDALDAAAAELEAAEAKLLADVSAREQQLESLAQEQAALEAEEEEIRKALAEASHQDSSDIACE
jgi:regulator of replication initiation timing